MKIIRPLKIDQKLQLTVAFCTTPSEINVGSIFCYQMTPEYASMIATEGEMFRKPREHLEFQMQNRNI